MQKEEERVDGRAAGLSSAHARREGAPHPEDLFPSGDGRGLVER